MKIFLFYFKMAIKITGSAQNYRVGWVSGNTPIFFRPYIVTLVLFKIFLGVCMKYPILFGYPIRPDILGVQSRCWGRAYWKNSEFHPEGEELVDEAAQTSLIRKYGCGISDQVRN